MIDRPELGNAALLVDIQFKSVLHKVPRAQGVGGLSGVRAGVHIHQKPETITGAQSSSLGSFVHSSLRELKELAHSAGFQPVGEMTFSKNVPDARLFVGSGKAQEMRGW